MHPAEIENLLKRVTKPAEEALRLHPLYRGKVQIMPKCPVRGPGDFAIWYSPGVAAPCRAIRQHPDLVFEFTNKGNTVAVVSDGTRILGLGDIGPEAGLPVMEGKALLFKYLGGVDAFPLCLRTHGVDELINAVKYLEPSFGAVNLEDISQPNCFSVMRRLQEELNIPVWHDDQQGTAVVILAAMLNALKLVEKDPRRVKIALIGAGAAGVATYHLLKLYGIDVARLVACDSKGTLHRSRTDLEVVQNRFAEKWAICCETNTERITGGVAEALSGADVCVAVSQGGAIRPEWVRAMARDAVVFACANPEPEIWPWEAKTAGAQIVGTGRGDFPNQINNSLAFPGVFRGALDVRAGRISDEMGLAAADALATFAEVRGISEDDILPRMEEWDVYPRIAAAVGVQAVRQGLARFSPDSQKLYEAAKATIKGAREAVDVLLRADVIAEMHNKAT
jgi:malate dehydrogenase (oxaloacetate-decarboxylating)